MDLNLIEISQQISPDGRRRARFALHEIYPNESYCNLNGITYLEKYTKINAPSIIGMPICASFLDNMKDIPYDHGMTGHDDSMPLFENSEQVGAADGWSIEDIIVGGETKRALVCDCYINQQRYPLFVDWLERCQASGTIVHGSIEFVGTKENGRIIYKDGKTQDDKYRVPIEYVYSGFCIISVKPSDDTAIMVELNQLNNINGSKNKEEHVMDEKQMEQLVSSVKTAIAETNSKNTEYETKISELNASIEDKDKEIAALIEKVEAAEKAASEKEEKLAEANALIEQVKTELNECKKENAINELNLALEKFTDEEKKVAEAEINSFKEDFTKIEINSIVTKINAEIGAKTKEAQLAEINSAKSQPKVDDIFGFVDEVDTKETVIDLEGIFE